MTIRINILCSFAFISLFAPSFATGVCRADEAATKPTPSQLEFVRSKVLPLLEARCFQCHRDADNPKGGLLLSSRAAMLKGGDSGAAIIPGTANESLLIEAVRYESFEMPPRSRMPEAEVKILEKWIDDGAPWPPEMEPASPIADRKFPLEQRRQSHWAWQPIEDPEVPLTINNTWASDSIDAFVLSGLEASGLTPAADADRYTLVRRIYFDLIGLPPTADQVAEFVNDSAHDKTALTKVVDKLLESPRFGERWGRHWLDLVRYAESLGHEFDYPLHHAHEYRDYVIRAFNADVPYDQLIREHVAGDLISEPRRHPTHGFNESIIGTGFWYLNEDKHSPVDVRAEEAAKIDNRIDVFSKAFLGMTVACARCHDHKFDAISTQDYYALAGFLQSSRRQHAYLDPDGSISTHTRTIVELREAAHTLAARHSLPKAELRRYILAAVAGNEPPGESTPSTPLTDHSEISSQLAKALAQEEASSPRHLLSLPATLAKSAKEGSSDSELTQTVDRWMSAVQQPNANTDTSLFADFAQGLPDGWFALGHAFANPTEKRLPQLTSTGQIAFHSDGIHSGNIARKLRGAVTSPTFELQHPEILLRVAGEDCRVRLVIDGYTMYEFNGLLFGGFQQAINTDGKYQWIRLAGDVHRYQGHRVHLEILDEGDGWFDLREVRFAKRPGAQPAENSASDFNQAVAQRLKGNPSKSLAEVIEVWLQHIFAEPTKCQQLCLNQLLYSDETRAELTTLRNQWQQTADSIPAPMTVLAMTEGTPENERVFIRGSHNNLGQTAPRAVLTALRNSSTPPEYSNSGRMHLAENLISESNPLTARVAVNRIWHQLFGRGIVASTDNFGVLGQPPTHPLLLDHLAVSFRRSGWSFKQMIRRIVLSRTYRMSSQATDEAAKMDPTNARLHHFRVRRLQGEAIRDALLAVSGRLDTKMFGPPVPVHLTPFMTGRGRPASGPLDGNGRRSIYISVRRNFLSPLMLAFDVPAPVSTAGKRTSSNVPAQALLMLNNEFVNQQATLWADRLLSNPDLSTQELLSRAWLDLYSRPISQSELELLLEYSTNADGQQDERVSRETLTEICHVLMNAKDFTFLR